MIQGAHEIGNSSLAVLDHLFVLQVPQEWIGAVEFGAVRRQVVQVDAMVPQCGHCCPDLPFSWGEPLSTTTTLGLEKTSRAWMKRTNSSARKLFGCKDDPYHA